MITLAEKDKCTGCGACAYVCPKQCIKMRSEGLWGLIPFIDSSECIECEKCKKTCPILNPAEKFTPIKTYAARSTDKEEVFSSASGGIASSLYKDAIQQGAVIAGAVQATDFSVSLLAGEGIEWIERFKNSKYVFSEAGTLYPQLADKLKQGKKVVVAALPCQIAAIRKIFSNYSGLYLIDIVCHGTTPIEYLQQHIRTIEKKQKCSAVKMYFRDPNTYTYTFTFTLYDSQGKRFYAKRTKDGDTYQYGYHRAVSYRENCYHCPFANSKRTGDISLADYPGLGKSTPFPYERKHINCVLINTEKGNQWFQDAINKRIVSAYERPIEEAINGNGQLRNPVKKSKDRMDFEISIRNNGGDFESAMIPIMKRGLRKEKIKKLSLFPRRIVDKLKRITRKII